MYATTREFVQALESAGELTRVKERVSPILEITQWADRESKSPAPSLPAEATRKTDPRFHHLGGKALLFESVEGSDIPVVINQFGSYRRVEMALGCGGGLESLAARLGKLVKPEPPPTLMAKIRKIPELLAIAKLPPKRVRTGICQEIVKTGDQIDLKRLPLIRCWPLDGDLAAVGHAADANDRISGVESGAEWNKNFRGRYITLAGIHTIHRDDLDHPSPPSRNIGMYRVQLLGKRHMAMHWHMHHDGARHWRSWKAKGEKMPVAIALGGESVLPYAATAPMPPGISELLLAGFLNRGAISLVRCKTVPIDVPANSEIVIEGWVDVEPTTLEGPFGDHTGFYSLPDRYPLMEMTAITHRHDPIYPTTVVGLPPQEDYFLGKATERLFLPLLRTIVPDIIDYDLPMFGAFHNCAFVKIKKEYPLHARRVMSAIWGAGQMSWTKTIVVVDEESGVDVHDTHAVLRAVGERCDPARDTVVVDGPLDILDHAAPYLGAGSKIGFDATEQSPERKRGADHPMPTTPLEHPALRAANRPAELGGHWLLVSLANPTPAAVDAVAARIREQGDPPPYSLLLGPDVDVTNIDEALFHWCANFDPRRDSVTSSPLNFDATPKRAGESRNGLPCRDWPPIIRMSEEVIRNIGAK